MFVGYQNDKIAFATETREELENMPCVTLDKIEETDKTYFLHSGEYVCEVPYEQQVEEIRQARESAYRAEVDSPLMAEYNRKKTFNLFEEGEEEKLLVKITAKVEEIKTRFPYPVEPIEKIEEVPVVEEEVVSKSDSEEAIEDDLQKQEKEIEESSQQFSYQASEEPAVELYSMEI